MLHNHIAQQLLLLLQLIIISIIIITTGCLVGVLLVSRSGLVEEDAVEVFHYHGFSWCTISSLFRENNNVVVFQFPFHIFMPLVNLIRGTELKTHNEMTQDVDQYRKWINGLMLKGNRATWIRRWLKGKYLNEECIIMASGQTYTMWELHSFYLTN